MIRRQETVEVECFKYGEKGYKCRECPLWRVKRKRKVIEKMAHVARPQKAQQKELRRAKEGEVAHMAKPQEA